jgi:hypothetical protein
MLINCDLFAVENEFWQNGWSPNITGKIPLKANAILSWRHPNMMNEINEPLAYIISNTSMYKFNFWNYPTESEAIDTRFFLFDCVKTNSIPDKDVFLGPSYKQALIENDVYKVTGSDQVTPFEARLLNEKRRRHDGLVHSDDKVITYQLENEASSLKFSIFSILVVSLSVFV